MKHLFVVGLDRSGTTAIARIIDGHSQVVLGMERFKSLWTAQEAAHLTPALFEEGRFFDFSSHRFTNLTPDQPKWAAYYEQAQSKYGQARYVGDKVTRPAIIPVLRQNFPDARFLFIARDVFEVAHSWERRATRNDTAWGADHNAQAYVKEWNAALRTMLDEHQRNPRKVTLVDYGRFFAGEDLEPLRDVVRALRLPMEPKIRKMYGGARRAYVERVAPKPRTLPPSVEAFIEETADFALWNEFRTIAGSTDTADLPAPPPAATSGQARSLLRTAASGRPDTRPNLLVAGVQKAGTTWLHAQLAKHPDIFMSEVKEIGYFNNANNVNNAASFAAYVAHFTPGAEARYRGESTPHYFWRRDPNGAFSPAGQHDMAEFVRDRLGPDLRIVVSLRDPVSRAVSGYFHNIAMGRIGVEDSLFRCPPAMGLVDLGFYERHWRHWAETLGTECMHAVLFDDLVVDPAEYVRSVLTFLGLGFDDEVMRHLDATKLGERPQMNKLRETRNRISPQEIAALVSLYEDDIAFVERLTGRDLATWRDLDRLVARNCQSA